MTKKKFFPKINIKNILLRNTLAKIVSVAIAIILWVFVASGQGTLGKVPGHVSIKANNVADGLVAIYDETDVEVQIMAEPNIWRKISSSSFSASVDCAGLSEGTYELEVSVVTNVSDIQIVRKNPTKILVSLEKIISKKVNINTQIRGDAASGLVAGNIILKPDEVEASGPSSIINNLTEATVIIQLNGESEDFKKVLKVVALSDKKEEITSVSFSPEKVEARVSVVKASNNKTVGVKVNTSGVPAEGYFISKITPIPNTVDITGAATVLQSINYIETANINISDANTNFERQVNLIVPAGVALQKGEPNKIRVILKLDESDISRVVKANIIMENLGSGRSVASYSPKEFNVLVSGKRDLISALTPEDIKIRINLSDKEAGSHSFDISKDDVVVPSGIVVENILPTVISVVLE